MCAALTIRARAKLVFSFQPQPFYTVPKKSVVECVRTYLKDSAGTVHLELLVVTDEVLHQILNHALSLYSNSVALLPTQTCRMTLYAEHLL